MTTAPSQPLPGTEQAAGPDTTRCTDCLVTNEPHTYALQPAMSWIGRKQATR